MITLSQANTIVTAALAEARKQKLDPIVVAVLDAGGHLVAYQREDGAGIARFDIAFAKAWGSLGMGFGSRELTERVAKGAATFITALAVATNGRMAPSPGGIIIRDADNHVIGAVGISGDVGDKDEACGLAGIAAAGLRGQTGKAGA